MTPKAKYPVPLTILSGFLGAGKTTLLNHILHGNHGLRVAVLVNDFGSINIDSQLIVGIEGESVSLSNGCICCTIRDDLLTETVKLLRRPEPPEYILIETSGVSDPAAVATTFLMPEISRYIEVDGILTVIDAEHLLTLTDEFTELAALQIEVADIIILNKVDRVDKLELIRVRDYITEIAPDARILETTFSQVPLELLLGVGLYNPDRLAAHEAADVHVHAADEDYDHDHDEHDHDHHAHHDHSLVFNTWSWTNDNPLSLAAMQDFIAHLPTSIYRSKGVVYLQEFPDRRCVLQVVGKRAMLTLGANWDAQTPYNQIVVIGKFGGVDGGDLGQRLEACLASNYNARMEAQQAEGYEWEREDYTKM